jgi:replicative DNA helicase
LTDLDAMLGKVRPGDMMVVAGRPGMGKSAFAMQIADAMSSAEKPGLFFSLEMSAGQLVDRLMSSAGRVNLKKFRTAQFDDHDWSGLAAAVGALDKVHVYIDDHSTSLSQILSTMRTFKRRNGGIGPVVIDYIGLVQSSGDTREQEIAKITRSLKIAAKQLGCPVIALSQLNRKLEDRSDRRPQQADLRESGAVEQDADSILMLYRDEVYNPDTPDKGVCEILIRKNRHGETGMVPCVFRGDVVRFENFAGHYEPASSKPVRRPRDNNL